MTVGSAGSDCALNVSCWPQQAGLMLLAGVGVLACITSGRGGPDGCFGEAVN